MLYTWGSNAEGQLGLGHTRDQHEPAAVPMQHLPLEDFRSHDVKLVGGGNHAILLSARKWMCFAGSNQQGQLGCEREMLPRLTFFSYVQIFPNDEETPVEIIDAACGFEHSLILLSTGHLLALGESEQRATKGPFRYRLQLHVAQLNNVVADGENPSESADIQIQLRTTSVLALADLGVGPLIDRISCGVWHSAALTKDSTQLYLWGRHVPPTRPRPNDCCQRLSRSTKSSYTWPPEQLCWVEEEVLAMASGKDHEFLLLKDGRIQVVGFRSRHGEDRVPSSALVKDSFTSIRSGWNFACVWSQTSLLFFWGRYDRGQFGVAPQTVPSLPYQSALEQVQDVQCGAEHCLLLNRRGECWAFGWNEHGNCGVGSFALQDQVVPQLVSFPAEVKTIGCGYGFSMAWTADERPRERFNCK